jgi:Mn2+/Fe2+ NRAMP family transporter
MPASELIITGLVMNVLGIILLVVCGVRTGRHSVFVSSSSDKEIKINRWYTFFGWFGLALIMLGTVAQIYAIFFAAV